MSAAAAAPRAAPETRPRQREAITSWQRGDVCVVAGPGSGKTFVLVERFRWLVREKAVRPGDILAITFTNQAADNMRRRLVESFPLGTAERQAVERAYISTIDAFCTRLLRENAVAAGVDPEFRVLDDWEAEFELRRAIEAALERQYRGDPQAARDFLAQFGGGDLHRELRELYHALRAAGLTVAEAERIGPTPDLAGPWQHLLDAYRRLAGTRPVGWKPDQLAALAEALGVGLRLAELPLPPPVTTHLSVLGQVHCDLNEFKRRSEHSRLMKQIRDELAPACRGGLLLEQNAAHRRWLFEALLAADRRYRDHKRRAGALDYADLEEAAVGLLERARPAPARFSCILMDEFQDTNPLQARLVELLRRGDGSTPAAFFAVGDINQSIYGFRHADPTVFRDYREQVRAAGGHVVELEETFRSRQPLLDAITTLINDAEGVEPHRLEALTSFPAREGPCLEILAVQAADNDDALLLEARHVAARIHQLCGQLRLRRGLAGYGDFAVLLRTIAHLRVFERVLRRCGVPCQVVAGRGFYETQEVHDLLHFLRLLLNPLDEISLASVLRSPLVGLSDDTLLRLKLAAVSLMDGVRRLRDGPAEEIEKIERFERLYDRFRRARDYTPLDRLLSRLLDETGYEAWLEEQPGGAHMAANVRKFLTLARRWSAAGLCDLAGFVERVEDLRRDEVREAEALPPEQPGDVVQLMTVHAAKGLEFPVVFLPSINARTRPDRAGISFAPGIGVGLSWKDPATGEGVPDSIAMAVAQEHKQNRRDESDRLFYVGMTRAEELLVLGVSGPKISRTEWARALIDNLGLDLKQFDNQAQEQILKGLPVRLLRSNQEPPPAPPTAAPRAGPPAARLERPVPDEQSDTSVAATSVALFAQCPRRYYLSRYLGLDTAHEAPAIDEPPPERDEMDASEFGRLVHGLLSGQLARDGAPAAALRLAARFEASLWGQRAAAAARIEREQTFLVSLDGRLLRGQIDLWFEHDGEVVLIDYKTDQVKPAEVPLRAAEYELQLRLYALALEAMLGARPAHAILYFLRPNLPFTISLDDVSLAAARRKVAELFEAQSSVTFPLRVAPHCFRCPHFKGACPAELQRSLFPIPYSLSLDD